MSEEIKGVGVIGLGNIGSGIAKNIIEAGYDVTVYNRSPTKMEPFLKMGAKPASSPREAADGVDVILTSLMDDESVESVTTGEDGLLAGLKSGGIHIGATTISPRLSSQLAEMHRERGSYYIAAPISGRGDYAQLGKLITQVAGEKHIVEKCMGVLESYTQTVTYMGEDHRAAANAKLAINYMTVAFIELYSQCYAFGLKCGISTELMHEFIETMMDWYSPRKYAQSIIERVYEPANFKVTSGFKDVQLMLESAREVGAPLHYASLISDKYITLIARGMAHLDWSAIHEVNLWNAGLD
jgi:3-hydroxyisobutyrate dehydrogenase-like beta-hydroxyacid dehydrogenase